ncbi:MAG: TolC family protein, partial [Candidatus Competibacter sp.]|nr:TolC family protein [Candidatus Competibacter sp.]
MKAPFPATPASLLVALLLSGCTAVGPNYAAPELATPATWRGAVAARVAVAPTTPEDLATWWRQLDDPTLTSLVEQALQTSLDLRAAQAK